MNITTAPLAQFEAAQQHIAGLDFGTAFHLSAEGAVTELQAPAPVTVTEQDGAFIDSETYADLAPDWSPVTGYSGQYGYAGPVMHPSEFAGTGMVRDMAQTPGIYVLAVVEDSEDPEADFEGWILLRHR